MSNIERKVLIDVETKVNDKEISKLKKDLEKMVEYQHQFGKTSFIDNKYNSQINETVKKIKQLQKENEKLNKSFDYKKNYKNTNAAASFINKNAFGTFGLDFSLKNLASAAVDLTKKFVDLSTGIATYNTGTSLISNASARTQAMKYGLNASQNYALTTTMSMLGMSDETDLYYMNDAQRSKFNEYMSKYSSWYEELESSGVLESIQEMQLEFAEFKQEMGMKLLSWISNNKDTIMFILDSTMTILERVANAAMSILDIVRLHWNDVSEASTNANYNYKTSNVTITNNNTLNNTNSATADTLAEVLTYKEQSLLF